MGKHDVDIAAQTRLQWARWAWSCPTHRTLLAMHPSWLTVAGRKMLRVATPLHTACWVSGCSDLDDKVWMPAGPAGCKVMESTGAQGGFPLQTGRAAFLLFWTCEATWSHPCRMSWRSTGLLKSTLWRKWCHRWAAIRRWAFLSFLSIANSLTALTYLDMFYFSVSTSRAFLNLAQVYVGTPIDLVPSGRRSPSTIFARSSAHIYHLTSLDLIWQRKRKASIPTARQHVLVI